MGVHFVIASLVLALIANGRGVFHARADDTVRLSCKLGVTSCNPGCSSVVICLNNEQIVVSNCTSTNLLCDSTSLTCKPASEVATCTTPPDESQFRCHATGNFPNPFDCHSYFNCDPPGQTCDTVTSSSYPATGTLIQCPGTTAYDSLTEDCRMLSTDPVCTAGPVPKCTKASQNGPLDSNPNIYYVCVNDPATNSLLPWIFKCPNITQVFVTDGQCQERDAVKTATDTRRSPSAYTAAAVSTTTQYNCVNPSTVNPDPLDYRSYYLCTADLQRIHYTCRTGYYYDQSVGVCAVGDCETTASTTPAQSVTTVAPTSTTTLASTTSTTAASTTSTTAASTTTTTTTAASTTTRYYCFQPGTTVADPQDCRSYYLCTSNMQQIHYTCRTGYYYDPRTAYCLKGTCSN